MFKFNIEELNQEAFLYHILLQVNEGNQILWNSGHGSSRNFMKTIENPIITSNKITLKGSKGSQDSATFELNSETGDITVTLDGHGGKGGNVWYYISKKFDRTYWHKAFKLSGKPGIAEWLHDNYLIHEDHHTMTVEESLNQIMGHVQIVRAISTQPTVLAEMDGISQNVDLLRGSLIDLMI